MLFRSRASAGFLRLQEDLSDVEDKIAFARQFYNRNVLDYNTRIATYPDVVIARNFNFSPAEFFSTGDDGRAEVHVNFDRRPAGPDQRITPPAA